MDNEGLQRASRLSHRLADLPIPSSRQPLQRVVKFDAEIKSTLQQLVNHAAPSELLTSGDFLIYIAYGDHDAGGSTEYGAMDQENALHLFGKDMDKVLRPMGYKPKALAAYVTIKKKQPVVDQVAIVSHEIALHVIPFFDRRKDVLGAPEVVAKEWQAMVTTGALSEEAQHDLFGAGNTEQYAGMIKAAMTMMSNENQKGELVFYFLGDYIQKANAYAKKIEQTNPDKAAKIKAEVVKFLELIGPYEKGSSEEKKKGPLAAEFDAILAGIAE